MRPYLFAPRNPRPMSSSLNISVEALQTYVGEKVSHHFPSWRNIEPTYNTLQKNTIFQLLQIFFFFLGLHLWHMEVPKLGVELELQLLATPQPQQRQILKPLNKAKGSSSLILVGFVSTVSQKELPVISTLIFKFQGRWRAAVGITLLITL